MDASTKLGIPFVAAANDPNAPAVSCVRLDHTIDEHSRRNSAFDAFLPPHVWARPNLTVCTGVVVDSIDFEETADGPRAAGVRIEHEIAGQVNKRFYVSARHEVIVSAGAISSPQILMLR